MAEKKKRPTKAERKRAAKVDIQISPQLGGKLTALQLLASQGSFALPITPIEDGHLFLLRCGEWSFSAGFHLGGVIIHRNGLFAGVIVEPGPFVAEFSWATTFLAIRVWDRSPAEKKEIRPTPFTLPPSAMLRWARARSLLPVHEAFEREDQVLDEVVVQLQSLQANIDAGGWDAFWEAGEPKGEPRLTQYIYTLIRDALEVMKGIDVRPEDDNGSGRLDFLFTARLTNGEPVKVCCEFKFAHSPKLVHGVQVQLPAYMAQRQTTLGIYAVLDFGRPPVVEIPLPGWPSSEPKKALGHLLSIYVSTLGIHYVPLRVTKPVPPSQMANPPAGIE